MTKTEAIEELLYQSGRHSNIESERWKNGFLGMLRPFQGNLTESNFHKIVKSLDVLYASFYADEINTEIIASIFGICHLARAWALHPNGMLQSNNLIRQEEVKQIENWIEQISYITFSLLDGCEKEVAFEFYYNKYPNQK